LFHYENYVEGDIMMKVTVIGLGAMGTALAQCLLKNNYRLTVWNRSPDKIEPLVLAGAAEASLLAKAVAASPIVIVCIKNHEETLRLLEPLGSELNGKTIVDLSTGDAADAEKLVSFLHAHEAEYLIGMINAYPSGVGEPDTTIITVGAEDTWARYSDVIKTLGGSSSYVGTEPSALAALFAALFTTRQGFMFGMIYGALVCQKAGVPLQAFSAQIPVTMGMMKNYYKVFADTVPTGNFDNAEATMATYYAALDDALQTFKSTDTPCELPKLMCDKTKAAMNDGLSDKQLTALVKHMLT
jgi:3-hydroxyisobutyrate dehydrogenase-like beta-hydroxyacid dehydrogenase